MKIIRVISNFYLQPSKISIICYTCSDKLDYLITSYIYIPFPTGATPTTNIVFYFINEKVKY